MIAQTGFIAFQGCQGMALAHRPSDDRQLVALFLAINTGWIIRNQFKYFHAITIIPFSPLGAITYRYRNLLINSIYLGEDPQRWLTKKEK